VSRRARTYPALSGRGQGRVNPCRPSSSIFFKGKIWLYNWMPRICIPESLQPHKLTSPFFVGEGLTISAAQNTPSQPLPAAQKSQPGNPPVFNSFNAQIIAQPGVGLHCMAKSENNPICKSTASQCAL
jgi:hypothetical protein